MKRKLIWSTAAMTLLILPVGVVVLEGTTAPVADTAASSPATDVPATGDATAALGERPRENYRHRACPGGLAAFALLDAQ